MQTMGTYPSLSTWQGVEPFIYFSVYALGSVIICCDFSLRAFLKILYNLMPPGWTPWCEIRSTEQEQKKLEDIVGWL